MKILILTRSFDQRLGGMENHTRLVVKHFLHKGWRVTVATPELSSSGALFDEPDVRFIRLGKQPNDLTKYSFSFWLKIREYLISHATEYDVILNIGMAVGGSYFLPFRIKEKIVTIAHGTYFMERRTLLSTIGRNRLAVKAIMGIPYTYLFDHIQRHVNNISKKIICISDSVRESLITETKTDPKKIVTIRNFVLIKDFKQHKHRKTNDKFRLLFLSRLHKEKGILFLIESLKNIKQEHPIEFGKLECLVIGEGPDELEAKLKANTYNLSNVEFIGYVQSKNIPKLLAQADCFVFPTLRQEGLPLSLLEGMAAGLPVIASDIEGPNEVIENRKSGILFSPGNFESFEATLLELLNDRVFTEYLGKNAKLKVAKDFNADTQLAILDNVLWQTAKSATARRNNI